MLYMEAIIISGLPAVGKTTAATIIGHKLGLPVMGGGDILREMAIDRGYTATGEHWWDTTEGIKFIRERQANSVLDKEADKRLAEKIDAGNVVITSYTAPWIAKTCFKVWLIGSIEKRAERMAKRDGVSVESCIKVTKVRDAENRKLYLKLYNIYFGVDTKPFDMVVDTNAKTAEEVAEIVIKKLKERNNTT